MRADFFDALQPLLVCHTLPGLVGGLLRGLYLLRTGRMKGRRWLKMTYDLFGGLLVGTILGPALAFFSTVPEQPFSILEVLRSLPPWFAERWFISAAVGFSWLAALETSREKIASLVREGIGKPGQKGGD